MNRRILCVDDDPNVLAGLQRTLRREFELETVTSGAEALEVLARDSAFAVLVADMRMPGMDGLQLLREVRRRHPELVRVMLTGNADQKTAIDAVNEGQIFRFLNKPCLPAPLGATLRAALEQHRLLTAERELLEKTLSGSVAILTDILSVQDPGTFGRGQALRERVRQFGAATGEPVGWEIEVAALLAQIGLVTLPPSVLGRARRGRALEGAEADMWRRVPEVGAELLARIPRLEPVAEIVRYQRKRYDGTGPPRDLLAGEALPRGARLLKVLGDLLELEARGAGREAILDTLGARAGWYDPRLLAGVGRLADLGSGSRAARAGPPGRQALPVLELRVGQVLVADVVTAEGLLLVGAEYRLTPTLLEKMRNFARLGSLREPIWVRG